MRTIDGIIEKVLDDPNLRPLEKRVLVNRLNLIPTEAEWARAREDLGQHQPTLPTTVRSQFPGRTQQ